MDANALYIGPDDAPDKYRLRRQIGGGGEAQLWEAEIEVGGEWERVAVKILRHELFDDPSWRNQWSEQAEMLRFIRHVGVVGVREHFEGARMHRRGERDLPGRAVYLTMNWVEGQTLREWLLDPRSSTDGYEALRHLNQVADVLDWLHSGQATSSGRPVFHADVTPNNVIVHPLGQAVLVDFGLARLAARPSSAGAAPGTGTSYGTAGFVAPELVAGGPVTAASDRYAFGALAYFVLTGETAPTDPAVIRERLRALPQLQSRPESIDGLMAMFDPVPESRPACAAWIRLFRSAGLTTVHTGALAPPAPSNLAPPAPESRPTSELGQHGTLRMPPTPPPPAPGPGTPVGAPARRKRSRLVPVAFAAAAAVLVAGIAFAATRGGNDGGGDAGATTTIAAAATTTATTPSTSAAAATTASQVTNPPTTLATTTSTTAAAPTTAAPTTAAATTAAATTAAATTSTTVIRGRTPVKGVTFTTAGARVQEVTIGGEVLELPATEDNGFFGRYSIGVPIAKGAKRLHGSVWVTDLADPPTAKVKMTILIGTVEYATQEMSTDQPYVFDIPVVDVQIVTFALPKWASNGVAHFQIALRDLAYEY